MYEYGFYECWKCLCEVCTRVNCPKNHVYISKVGHCIKMIRRDACPTIKCDYFVHAQKHKVLKVCRKLKKTQTIHNKLNEILQRLDNLVK